MELVQLADWITKLEPRHAQVWIYHAWNMSYNVSVMMPTPEDRWRWVLNGVQLLRDEALFYNPREPSLYHELGWFYFDKLASLPSEGGDYYRARWAEDMVALFGGPRPDYGALAADPVRRKRFVEAYKLFPDVMQDIERTFGEIDWRSPYAHALYWAYRGRPLADGFEAEQLDRLMKHAYRFLLEEKAGGQGPVDTASPLRGKWPLGGKAADVGSQG